MSGARQRQRQSDSTGVVAGHADTKAHLIFLVRVVCEACERSCENVMVLNRTSVNQK